jgi:hypothetical protein
MDIEELVSHAIDNTNYIRKVNAPPYNFVAKDKTRVFLLDYDDAENPVWFAYNPSDFEGIIDINRIGCHKDFFRKDDHPIIEVGDSLFRSLKMGTKQHDDLLILHFPYQTDKTSFGSITLKPDMRSHDLEGEKQVKIFFMPNACYDMKFIMMNKPLKQDSEFDYHELRQMEFKVEIPMNEPFSIGFMYGRSWIFK